MRLAIKVGLDKEMPHPCANCEAKIEAQLASVYNSTEATLTTQAFSGEMFTESSMNIQSVTFPSHNYFGFNLGYDKTNNNLIGGKIYTAS